MSVSGQQIRWHTTTRAPPPGAVWLTPAERELLAGLTLPKRRGDWLLGRWAAKRALAALLEGTTPAELEILPAASGAPQVTVRGRAAAVALSLSHAGGCALCAVTDAGVAVGCDVETLAARSDAFVRDYLTAGEGRRVAAAASGRRALVANLIWSAKESALKALRVGLRRDTRTVRVKLPDPLGAGDAWTPLAVTSRPDKRSFHGWWRVRGDQVFTVVAAPRPARPRAVFR